MKKLQFITLIIVLSLIGCSENLSNEINQNNSLLNYKVSNTTLSSFELKANQYNVDITFIVDRKSEEQHSQLIINVDGEQKIVTEFNVSPNVKYYKAFTADHVKLKADEIFQNYKNVNILTIAESIIINSFKEIIRNKPSEEDLINLKNLFYHKSILSSVIRAINEQKTDCECTVHPLYLVGKTNFHCQEDYFYDVNKLKNAISEQKTMEGDLMPKTQNLLNYLEKSNKPSIRFDNYYNFFVEKSEYEATVNHLKNQGKAACSSWCPWGCGSDLGCCGNYEGCCYLRLEMCLIHDLSCWDCEPNWFCFGGCVPEGW